jgi:hypothetical protein
VPASDGGDILNPIARFSGSLAEIHVLKPQRMEALVKALQTLPNFAPESQESASRLLYVAGLRRVPVSISVGAVKGIRGKQAVQTKYFENQDGRRRKPAD